jgi:hypothetical protein
MASCLPDRLGALLVFGGLAACSGPVAFERVQEEVLVPTCSFGACHGGPNGAGGLRLDGTAADALRLVEGTSAVAGRPYVVPGDPDASYLVAKLRGDAGISGDRMPPAAPLEKQQLAKVLRWIEGGAPVD